VQAVWLADGRLHLNHGPIDLIVQAEGPAAAAALAAAVRRMDGLLAALAAELVALRSAEARVLCGPVARRMGAAVAPFRPAFITPMAAVAGAVADEVLAAMRAAGPLQRAYVNNGGDIALFLAGAARFEVAMAQGGRIGLTAAEGIGGVATSGWGGRSQSFGIADAVTVLAATAAMADAAATMIANAVDLPGHPAIQRVPACSVKADSDLGARLVTAAVGPLTPDEVARALDRGAAEARALQRRGLIAGAALFLQSDLRMLGGPWHRGLGTGAGEWLTSRCAR
jgi:ApbE superfamily uncharacterized protein (UPF0280 family)